MFSQAEQALFPYIAPSRNGGVLPETRPTGSLRPDDRPTTIARKTNLSRIIDRVEHGEEIIITVNRSGRGSLAGQLVMAEDWDSPEVNESIARDFGAGRFRSIEIRSIGCSSPKLG